MNPTATLRFRRATAVLAVAWALLALVAGVRGNLSAATRPEMPFAQSGIAGRHVLHSLTPEALAAGLSPGDELLGRLATTCAELLPRLGQLVLLPATGA